MYKVIVEYDDGTKKVVGEKLSLDKALDLQSAFLDKENPCIKFVDLERMRG